MNYDSIKSNYKFYQSYVNLIELDQKLRQNRRDGLNDDGKELFEDKLSDMNFRNFILEKIGKNKKSIKILAPSLLKSMIRPQRLIMDMDNFYVGCDMMTNTYYICYKNLLMIDIDFYKDNDGIIKDEEKNVDCLENYINNFKNKVEKNECWKIYRSRNGIHAFLISESINYHSDKSINIMLNHTCDFYYIIYSYLRGYSVRLNRKKNEEEIKYEFITYIGNKKLINEELDKLVNLHIDLIPIFLNDGYSLMSGK